MKILKQFFSQISIQAKFKILRWWLIFIIGNTLLFHVGKIQNLNLLLEFIGFLVINFTIIKLGLDNLIYKERYKFYR